MLRPSKAAARLLRQFRRPIETACSANRKAQGGTMAKPAAHFESCCGGLCGAEAFESCCEAFGGFKACPKRATRQFRSPIETACRANRKAHGGTMAKPAARFESCCGGLCGAEAFESCCESFEGATRQFRSPIETACRANRKAHGSTMAKPAGRFESCCGGLCKRCHTAVSKPNRNSL